MLSLFVPVLIKFNMSFAIIFNRIKIETLLFISLNIILNAREYTILNCFPNNRNGELKSILYKAAVVNKATVLAFSKINKIF